MGIYSPHYGKMLMTKDDASNAFIRYWQLIVVMMSFAVGYGAMSTNISAMADDIKEQKAQDQTISEEAAETKEAQQKVRLSVVSIEKDIEHIKENQEKTGQET